MTEGAIKKDLRCEPLPFQAGDEVRTPRGTGTVTAVGMIRGTHLIVYRVGQRLYWSDWQLQHLTVGTRRTRSRVIVGKGPKKARP